MLGMPMLAVAISLTAKTGRGVSPIIVVAICVSEVFNLNFGDMTFLLYTIFVVAQLVLRDRREHITVI